MCNRIHRILQPIIYDLLTKSAAGKNGVALSYYKVRGLYFLAVFCEKYICIYFVDYTTSVLYFSLFTSYLLIFT